MIATASIVLTVTLLAAGADDSVKMSPAKKDADGILVHEVRSPHQAGVTHVRILLPDKLEPGKRYPVVYVLPVEAQRENRYGDGLAEVRKHDLHNKLQAIFVAPTFSHLPWYADHPTKADVRQETYFLKVIVPFIEKHYPVQATANGRLLLGFSKSGWGAFSLLLRHPTVFGKAAAWDAPLMMTRPDRFGMGDIFGTEESFEKYQITKLLAAQASTLKQRKRLLLLGYGNFRDHHEKAHALMDRLGIVHDYRDGPARQHDWHSGWVSEAVRWLFSEPPATPAGDSDEPLPLVRIAADKRGFALGPSGKPFAPWGFNYDHDAKGRLIEDYWQAEWSTVEQHFTQMKKLGANVVRVHLQFGKFMDGADKPSAVALARLDKLLELAERLRLYLDITGLGCYHKKDVPAWYDALSEQDRWAAQARFWRAIAGRCKDSRAVFCYDLMNEPVVPGGRREAGAWLAGAFAGKHFVQFITRGQADRPRPTIARAWIKQLVAAIREQDRRHLVTVGLVDWSLDRPGLTSGFVPEQVAGDLDFVSVHIYPRKGKIDDAVKTLAGFAVGKPVVIEETFPLACSTSELEEFITASRTHAAGWIGFYWGKPPEELRRSRDTGDAMTLGWLELFVRMAKDNDR